MNITIIGHHVEVTPAIREYVNQKIGRVVKHFDQVTTAQVTLSVEKLLQKAEVTLHVKGKDIHADCSDADMYAAIDKLSDKIDRQVLKHKEKAGEHTREKRPAGE